SACISSNSASRRGSSLRASAITASPCRRASDSVTGRSGELCFQGPRLLLFTESIDHIVQVAVQQVRQVVPSVSDAVVGHPVLRVVVGTYLLCAVTAPDLGPPVGIDLLALSGQLHVEQAGAKHGHRLRLVLE